LLQLFRLITSMDSDNYPESCHAIYILNGGAAFAMIWRVVSNFVDKGTRDKVHVLGPREQTQVRRQKVCRRGETAAMLLLLLLLPPPLLLQ
jgi:hypothetical protein